MKNIFYKIKSNEGKISTNFHSDKVPKEDSQHICLSVILIGSGFRTGKNYCPQVFLEKCKYIVKDKEMSKYITDQADFENVFFLGSSFNKLDNLSL